MRNDITMTIEDRNRSFPGRKPNLWIYYWMGRKVGEPVHGDMKAAKRMAAELQRQIKNGTWLHPSDRRDTSARFDTYGRTVVAMRAECGIGKRHPTQPNGHEISILETHLIPEFGNLLMRDLTSHARVKEGFLRIAEKPPKAVWDGKLSSGTVNNCHKLFCRIMEQGVRNGIITHLPPRLKVTLLELPAPQDKRPDGWRDEAVYHDLEIAAFAARDMNPTRKMFGLLAWFTGSRAVELRDLKIQDYQPSKKPLSALIVPCAKTKYGGGKRPTPVHPELKPWLDWWIAEGFEHVHGRAPRPQDWFLPTPSPVCQSRGETQLSHGELYYGFQTEIKELGFAQRRVHDTRRTLISAFINGGADERWARKITHGSLKDLVINGYSTVEWGSLCQAMLTVSWKLPAPPWRQANHDNVIHLRTGTLDPAFAG
jgi:integrase